MAWGGSEAVPPLRRGERRAILVALVAAVVLRFWNLGGQVPVVDEIHLLRAVLSSPLVELATTFREFDVSPPVAALARLTLVTTGALGTAGLRGLPFAAGLLLLVAPLAFRRPGDPRGATALWTALIAVSPLLVAYSRIARGYLPAAAALAVATLAIVVGLERGRRAAWVGAGLATSFALWALPLVAPAAAALWLGAGLLACRQAPAAPRARALAGPLWGLAAGGAATLLWLVPAAGSLGESLLGKGGRGRVDPAALGEAARLLTGASSTLVALLLFGAILGGAAVALGAGERRAALFAALIVGQSAGLLALRPLAFEAPDVAARYLLPVWPVALALAAGGLARAAAALRPGVGGPALVLAVAGLVLAGPLVRGDLRRSSFVHHPRFLRFTQPPPAGSDALSALAPELAPGPLLELPWSPHYYATAIVGAQRRHGFAVRVSTPELSDPRLALRALVPFDRASWLAADARWLVLHRRPGREEQGAADEAPGWAFDLPEARRLFEAWQRAATETEAQLVATWGAPDQETPELACWDLARRRSAPDLEGD